MDLIERLRREADISARPGQMDRLNALADGFAAALEAARKDACVALVADIRFACGDNGRRMQPELVDYIREMARSHARLQGALPGIVTTAGTDPESWQPRVIVRTTEAALLDAPPMVYRRVRVVVEDWTAAA